MTQTRPWIRSSSVALVAAIVLAGALAPVFAQDGLYAPRVPGDASMVRVANLSSAESPRIDIGAVRFGAVPAAEVTPYRSVPPGIYMVGGRARGVMFSPGPASFNTIVVSPAGEIVVLVDQAHRDPARAQLVLYNFAGNAADLIATRPEATVFESVLPGESEAVAVNAIPIDLAARVNGGSAAYPVGGTLAMERGASYSVFVTPDGAMLRTAAVATD